MMGAGEGMGGGHRGSMTMGSGSGGSEMMGGSSHSMGGSNHGNMGSMDSKRQFEMMRMQENEMRKRMRSMPPE